MWCLTSDDTVYHRICDDKAAKTFKELVGDYEGVIVCDALRRTKREHETDRGSRSRGNYAPAMPAATGA